MRNFDLWQNFFDNQGNFLHGRFLFCQKGTTNPVSITDAAGTAIPNPMYSGTFGQTAQQVFLPDVDVTLYKYKYIGNGTMESDETLENWALVDTVDILDPAANIVITGTSSQDVNTMAELRALDPATAIKVNGIISARLNGYDAAGDSPSRLYVWNSASTSTDDGGSVIAHSGQSVGRWLLVCAQILDVRFFGVFPSQDKTNINTNVSQFANALNYAIGRGVSIYLPGVYTNGGWYEFNGGNFVLENNLYVDGTTYITAKGGTATTLTFSGGAAIIGEHAGLFDDLYDAETASFTGGTLNVSLPSVRTSSVNLYGDNLKQGKISVIPTDTLVVDADHYTRVSGINRIIVDVSLTSKKTWAAVNEVVCNAKLVYNAYDTFANLYVRDDWYTALTDFHADQWTDCIYSKESFKLCLNWVNLSVKDGVTVFDFMGDTLTDAATFSTGSTLINATVKNAVFPGGVTLENCDVSDCTVPGGGVEAVESAVGITSSVTGAKLINCTVAQDITITGDANLERCDISHTVICSGVLNVKGCTVTAYVFAKANSTKNIYLYAHRNTLTTGAGTSVGKFVLLYDVHEDSGSVFFNGEITDNTVIKSGDGNNFVLNEHASFLAASGHNYSYSGNKGADVKSNDPKILIGNDGVHTTNIGDKYWFRLVNFKPYPYLFYIGTGTEFPGTVHAKITSFVKICEKFKDATNNCPKEMQAGFTESMVNPGDFPYNTSRTKDFILSGIEEGSVIGEYNPTRTPATNFVLLCYGSQVMSEISVLVEMEVIA